MVLPSSIVLIVFLVTKIEISLSNDPLENDRIEEKYVSSVDICTQNILNAFNFEKSRKRDKIRKLLPTIAFLDFVEKDLLSPEAEKYFKHLHSLMIHKDHTHPPQQYCLDQTKDLKSDEGKTCLKLLFSVFQESVDPTQVIRDTFQKLKRSDFTSFGEKDYRYKYFYYLSGNFQFSRIFDLNDAYLERNAPLTPYEFCVLEQNYPSLFSHLGEPVIAIGEGTSFFEDVTTAQLENLEK